MLLSIKKILFLLRTTIIKSNQTQKEVKIIILDTFDQLV